MMAGRRMLPSISPTAPPSSPTANPMMPSANILLRVKWPSDPSRSSPKKWSPPRRRLRTSIRNSFPLPEDERPGRGEQEALGYEVAGEAAEERAREGRNAHHQDDALVNAAFAEVAYRAAERGEAGDQYVGASGYRGGHSHEEHRGQPYRAEREPDEAAKYPNEKGYDGENGDLPDGKV